MTYEPRYKTPEAVRKAVTDRLRTAAESSPWKLTDLHRQFAYDQLVERLYQLDPNWVIKGATALLGSPGVRSAHPGHRSLPRRRDRRGRADAPGGGRSRNR